MRVIDTHESFAHRADALLAIPIFADPMRILVAIAFILIIGSLASALVFLMKDKGKSNRTVKALAFRVGFSITLFVLLLVANQLGWIQPTGIR